MNIKLKRLLAKSLSMALLLSFLAFPVQATDNDPVVFSKTTSQSSSDISNRTTDITLSLTGKTADSKKSYADVVLVLDISVSMEGSITGLKDAAKAFVDKVLVGTQGSRVAIVSYSTSGTINSGFSDNAASLRTVIDGLSVGGGTNMHAGMLLARKLMENTNRADTTETVIFMSDGVPTYYLSSGDYRVVTGGAGYVIQHYWYKQWLYHNYYGWYLSNPVNGWRNYDFNANYFYGGVYGPGNSYDTNSYNAVQGEADAVKRTGTKIFTVGLAVPAEGDAVLRNLGDYAEASKPDQLSKIYLGLADQIASTLSGSGAIVTDTLPDGFEFVGSPPDGCTVNGKTITWNAGNIPFNSTIIKTFKVRPIAGNNYYGAYLTNKSAELTYHRYNQGLTPVVIKATAASPVALFSPVGFPDTVNASPGKETTIAASELMKNDIVTPVSEGGLWTFSTVTAIVGSNPARGTVSLVNGNFVYKSNSNFIGDDLFTYKLVTTATLKGTNTSVVLQSQEVKVAVSVGGLAPVVSQVKISGAPHEGQELTGTYVYHDGDGDAEGATTFKWYKGFTEYVNGTPVSKLEVIPGANTKKLTVTTDLVGSNIVFEVTPVSVNEPYLGTPVKSYGAFYMGISGLKGENPIYVIPGGTIKNRITVSLPESTDSFSFKVSQDALLGTPSILEVYKDGKRMTTPYPFTYNTGTRTVVSNQPLAAGKYEIVMTTRISSTVTPNTTYQQKTETVMAKGSWTWSTDANPVLIPYTPIPLNVKIVPAPKLN